MKPPLKTSFGSYHSRADRVAGIKKAVQKGSYEIDSTKIANTLIIHLLNHSIQFHRYYPKGQYTLRKLPVLH
jgi:hypothetical protein